MEADDDQSWYWTDEWQEGERQADAEIEAGRVERFDTAEDAIEWLTTPAPEKHPSNA